MYRKMLFLALVVLLVNDAAIGATVYPWSTVITNISFNWGTHRSDATGSDNWPITWHNDGHQYAAYGDGWGFSQSGTKHSNGFARVEGGKVGYVGYDIAEPFTGKCHGIISIDGTLYAWRDGNASGESAYDFTELWKSTNDSSIWSYTGVRWQQSDFSPPSDRGFFCTGFCQFGQSYAGARDNYVYMIATNVKRTDWQVQYPGEIIMMRVHKSNIENEGSYEFFDGMIGNNPTWTSNRMTREPIWQDSTNGVHRITISYNAPLGRYFLWTEHTARNNGNTAIYEAPEPWGPWKTVLFDYNFAAPITSGKGCIFLNFSNKWLSGDGKDFVAVMSVDDNWDTVEGSFTVVAVPYPQSNYITGMTWQWGTHSRAANGSDNWAITWSDDNHQYAAWGDGWGFSGTGDKMSLGVSRIADDFDSYTGTDLWGIPVTGEGGKSYGIISIDGVLYMWFGPGSNVTSYNWQKLKQSIDHGSTWTDGSWSLPKSTLLIMPTICNFGKDYAGARDNYVYSYFIRLQGNPGSLNVHIPGKIDLARVPKDHIMDQAYHEFFAGFDGNGDPTWTSSTEPADRVPVFEDAQGVGWNLSVSYNAGLGRYILATEHTASISAKVGFFESPQPWGPWRTIEYYDNWGVGSGVSDVNKSFYWNFTNKWLSPNGKDFVCVFSGINAMDSFNVVRGQFVVSTGINAGIDTPADGTEVYFDEPVDFSGSAAGGTPPYSYSWHSDVNGWLGDGANINVPELSVHRAPGELLPHTITLTVTDANDVPHVDTDQISLTVRYQGDFEPDGDVDLADLAVMVGDWLWNGNTITEPNPTGLTAHWKFDQTSGTTAPDSSSNGHNGTLLNSPQWENADVMVGSGALKYDGVDDRVTVASFDVVGGGITIAAWIKPTGFTDDARIVSKASGSGTSDHYWAMVLSGNGDNNLQFRLRTDASSTVKIAVPDDPQKDLVAGSWAHVALTWDGTTDMMRFYKDGNEIYSHGLAGSTVATASNVRIGVGNQSLDAIGGTDRPFKGLLDDVRVYARALPLDEIEKLAGVGPPPPTDLNQDGIVNLTDYSLLTENWLR